MAGKVVARQASDRVDRKRAKNLDFMKFVRDIEEGETLFGDAKQQADFDGGRLISRRLLSSFESHMA